MARAKKIDKTRAAAPRREVHYLRARPWLARQLGEDPTMALFWRDGPADSRQGMLWVLSACADPACTCREVFAQALTVSDSVVSIRLTDGKIETTIAPDPRELAGPPESRRASVEINVETGAVRGIEGKPVDQEVLEWVKAETDAQVLATLRKAMNVAKGRPPDAALVDRGTGQK